MVQIAWTLGSSGSMPAAVRRACSSCNTSSFSNMSASEPPTLAPAVTAVNNRRRSLRTAIEDRAVVLVAIDELDRAVGPELEDHVAHQRAARELALDMGADAVALALGVKERAHGDMGIDLLRGDFHFDFARVRAVALARNILRVVSGQ